MSDLIDTTEMYLKTIYELVEEGITPLRARIAERLGHSGPTVSQTVARMERDGLVVVTGDRHLELTTEGKTTAVRVMRKHRLAERLLTDIVGLEWPFVHEEACRWEHVMSERVEQRLADLLGHPTHDPYGNPIPGLSELGEQEVTENFLTGVISLADVVEEMEYSQRVQIEVRRIAEPLQPDIELLARFQETGVQPGGTLEVEIEQDRRGKQVLLRQPGAQDLLEIPFEMARHIFVAQTSA